MTTHPITSPFLRAIEQLLATNKLILYGRVDEVPAADLEAALELVKDRFEQEATGYPGPRPAWDAAAASWAIKVVFHAAQLLLYRSHEADALADYFPDFGPPKTAVAMISADIFLRYLPSLLQHLEAIDVEDELIPLLQGILHDWPYSGLLAGQAGEGADLDTILADECLAQLFVNRIIVTKNKDMALRPAVRGLVLAALGNHLNVFWQDLTIAL